MDASGSNCCMRRQRCIRRSYRQARSCQTILYHLETRTDLNAKDVGTFVTFHIDLQSGKLSYSTATRHYVGLSMHLE